MSDSPSVDPALTTPFTLCTCIRCGPPWRDEWTEPDKGTDFFGYMSWHSWMALCPFCGDKRCPGASDHDLHRVSEVAS